MTLAANRLHAHIWLLKTYAIPASMYASQKWTTPFLRQGREMDNPLQKWLLAALSAEKDSRSQRHHSFTVRCARVWPGASEACRGSAIQLVSRCNSFVQFPYPLQQFHDEEGFASWHAIELQVSVMLVLTHSFSHGRLDTISHHVQTKHVVQTKVVELWAYISQSFVVDLRDRRSEFWTPFSDSHSRERNSETLTYYQWCALPAQKTLVTHPPYRVPRYMLLDLPQDVVRSVACFRLCVHTHRVETTTWSPTSSPTCDVREADDDVQDEKHVLFHCPQMVSIRRKCAFLFSQAGSERTSGNDQQAEQSNYLAEGQILFSNQI